MLGVSQLVFLLPDLLLVSALIAYSSISHCCPAFVQPPGALSALKSQTHNFIFPLPSLIKSVYIGQENKEIDFSIALNFCRY